MSKSNYNSKEYTIFITCKGGKTYNLLIYYNILEAKQKLYEIINLERERRRPYVEDITTLYFFQNITLRKIKAILQTSHNIVF